MAYLNLANYSIDVLNESQSLFDLGWTLNKARIHEELNYFPTIELALKPALGVETWLPRFKDLTIKINPENDVSLEYNLGIQFISYANDIVTFKGKACKYADIVDIGSSFLGTDLESAILSLGIRNKLEGMDPIVGRFYQIDESRLSCLMKLLKGRNPNTVALITNSKIVIRDPAKTGGNELKDFISPTSIQLVTRNMSVSNDSYAESKIGDMFNYSYAGINAIGFNNPEYSSNYIKNIKYNYPLNITALVTYENYISYNIGDYMKLDMKNLPYTSALIIATDTVYDGNGRTTKYMQLGGTGETT